MTCRRLALVWMIVLLAGCAPVSAPSSNTEWSSGSDLDHATSGSWIERLNRYRAIAGVPAVVEDRRLSAADRAHARYLVKNFDDGVTDGASAHFETPGRPGYTIEGDGAGRRSDVALRKVILESPLSAAPDSVGDAAIDEWIAGPFHRLDLLDPSVTAVGWGSAREDDASASVLEVRRGRSWHRHRTSPVMFPSDGATVPFGMYPGGEWPDPLAACGYNAPSGLPITIQFGPRTSLRVGDHSMTVDGDPIEHCAYVSPDGRAAVIVPRAPMIAGHRYAVSIDVNGGRYSWSFHIAPTTPAATLSADASD